MMPNRIANRYQIEKTLGQGGMAIVYQVVDTTNGETVALKQLQEKDEAKNEETLVELFESEYHTLAQLAHPRIIEVYNYGKDSTSPYYTMELLDGGDLLELAPLPWKQACSLLVDACSALGLLHSRRKIHRDLTPRNIRCTRDGKAKLIDFGAMVAMGPCRQIVGTPAHTAPEVVRLQSLDARSDLYSLGTTLYYILTGRQVYPANKFDELANLWRSIPRPPSDYRSEIPKELDALVLQLINLDPMARPTNAAEVMERLSAIAGLETSTELRIPQAYLSKPTLVGRNEQLLRVRKQMVRAISGRGSTITIEGGAGVGRSRFLDACVLEGKLAGATVSRADSSDAHSGDWGVARAIFVQLLNALPEKALETSKPFVSVLGHVFPELCESNAPLVVFENPQERRPRIQSALCDWLLSISSKQRLLVAVDDIHRIDEPSASFLAIVAHAISKKRILLVTTTETGVPCVSSNALKVLQDSGYRIKLENLDLELTERLIESMFGDTPNIRLMADRLFAISNGNPQATMLLTQYLVDKGVVRYQSGAWMLPSGIDQSDLPQTLSETLKLRLQKLSSHAFALAQTIALCSKQNFDFKECLALTAHRDKVQLLQDLNSLVTSEILSTDGEIYSLSHSGWRPMLISELDPARAKEFHLRICDLLEKSQNDHYRVAQHLLLANEPERALNRFLSSLAATNRRITNDPSQLLEYARTLPKDWNDTLESLLVVCETLGRSAAERYLLRASIVANSAFIGRAQQDHILALVAPLYRDCGLDFYHEQNDSVEPAVRLERALALAQKRFESAPESEYSVAPLEAISHLTRVLVQALGCVGGVRDLAFFESLPSLEPFFSFSPALVAVQKNMNGKLYAESGRHHRSRQEWLETIEVMDQPNFTGLDKTVHNYMRLAVIFAMSTSTIIEGLQVEDKWIQQLEQDPLFEVNACRLRMFQALNQGDIQQAESYKRQVELLQIQNSPTQFFEGALAWIELLFYAAADDLIRVKQTIPKVEQMAQSHKGWIPCLHYAQGIYQRIRGDYANAAREFERSLNLISPGRHDAWAPIIAAYLSTLISLGRIAESESIGRSALEAAKQRDLLTATRLIQQQLALALAMKGDYESAVSNSESVIDTLNTRGITGVLLGSAYETRARVAILMQDNDKFHIYAKLCAEQYRTGHNPTLTAKYEKLMQEANQSKLGVSEDLAQAANFTEPSADDAYSQITQMMESRKGHKERAGCILDLIVDQSSSKGGFLYVMNGDQLSLYAQSGSCTPFPEMDTMAQARVSSELDDSLVMTSLDDPETEDSAADADVWSGQNGEEYRPVVLGHYSRKKFVLTGLAVLLVDPSKSFSFPGDTVSAASKYLVDVGVE